MTGGSQKLPTSQARAHLPAALGEVTPEADEVGEEPALLAGRLRRIPLVDQAGESAPNTPMILEVIEHKADEQAKAVSRLSSERTRDTE